MYMNIVRQQEYKYAEVAGIGHSPVAFSVSEALEELGQHPYISAIPLPCVSLLSGLQPLRG